MYVYDELLLGVACHEYKGCLLLLVLSSLLQLNVGCERIKESHRFVCTWAGSGAVAYKYDLAWHPSVDTLWLL